MAGPGKSEPRIYSSVKGQSDEEIMEKGRQMYRENKHDSAQLLFSIVAGNYDPKMSLEDKERSILAMNNVAVIYENHHFDYIQSYNFYSEALSLATEHHLTNAEAIIYLNMAELFRTYAENRPADVSFSKIEEFTIKGFRKAYQAANYECMAAILMNQLLYDLSTPTAPYKAIFDGNIPDTLRNVVFTRKLMRIADLYSAKQYNRVIDSLTNAFTSITSEWNPEHYEIALSKNIGDIYRKENNIPMARQWYEKALAEADSFNVVDQELAMLARLLRLPIEDADRYRIHYLEKKDSVMSNGRLSIVGELDFLRELKMEQQKSAELARTKRTLLIWIGVGGGVLLIISIFVMYIIRQAIRLRESNRALYLRINAQLDADTPPVVTEDDVPDAAAPEPPAGNDPLPEMADKYSSSSLSDERLDEIFNEIQSLLADPEIVCSPELSLSKLASRINVNTSYVSRVVNEKYGCSFSALVNDRRIRIACIRLSDIANYGNMTIEAISKSVGFSSRSTFIAAFKKANGMTPSEYLKTARAVDAEKMS